MSPFGFLWSVVFWLFSVLVLAEYEIHVRALRSDMRALCGAVAFVAGSVLGLLVTHGGRLR